ncbi:hypothetical protein BKN38_03295 [Helicobacter sp. CLO-3]|uniref:heavy metal translocating P-type ATPase n=1 Tax=unclassified Helicobacter TaxID=2593540 RepID=UPI000805D036|nr:MULTISPECIES: heavy metal translocating P-type ATPase [unclassified Helicobacter]OBV28511.1 hypothetical protein BA723_02050 [Helicobacter sp. CLO-3]OHU84176.1 hypothetical protein BKN38_03295 [Helicobacter sp. CLO-3]
MQKARIYIDGITCSACSSGIERSLKCKGLVENIQVQLIAKVALVEYDPESSSLEAICAFIKKMGYEPSLENPADAADSASADSGDFENADYKNMDSSTHDLDSKKVDSACDAPKMDSTSAESTSTKSTATESATTPAPNKQNAKTPKTLLQSARAIYAKGGFSALDKWIFPPKLRLIISAFCSVFIMYLAMFPMLPTLPMFSSTHTLIYPFDNHAINFATQLCLALIVMHMGRDFYFKGFKTLLARTPTMDTLIAISTSAALIYSLYSAYFGGLHGDLGHWYFESICVILTFVLFGKLIENSAKDHANEVINALLSRTDKQAVRVDSSGAESQIPVKSIRIGDIIKILPGSTIPVDGVVSSGEGGVDESMLSGEVIPVYKSSGARVFAGSVNTDRALFIRAQSTAEKSTLSALASLIQEAISSKPALASLADRVSAFFVPSVIFIALLAGAAWCVAKDFSFGFEIFISVLVISCPCALGLATPMAVMIGNALANKEGVFFKQAQDFERASKCTSVVFDKTGTLTQASLKVAHIKSFGALDEREILALSAGIEKGSEHLIARAIIKHAENLGVKAREFSDFKARAGFGMEALCVDSGASQAQTAPANQSKIYMLGNQEMFGDMDMSALDSSDEALLRVYLGREIEAGGLEADKKQAGKKQVGENQASENEAGASAKAPKNTKNIEVLGVIALEDTIKPTATHIIQALKSRHIKTYILSGDNAKNTAKIAKILGVDDFRAEAKPSDKLAFVRELQKRGEVVMMVGDGINDVGALEAADISVSFSDASDVSEKSAGVVIYNHDLMRIDYVLRLSRAILRNIKENLFWAFGYNIICIPLACGALYGAGILLNPMLAALAMSLSSVSVVLNAQRLWRFK